MDVGGGDGRRVEVDIGGGGDRQEGVIDDVGCGGNGETRRWVVLAVLTGIITATM